MTSDTLTIRYPDFDFSTTPVIWGPNAEAVIGYDASSPLITIIEVYLIKVMRRVKDELDPTRDAELIRDVDLFIKQEAQHHRVHAGFNKALREWCPAVAQIEADYESDLNEFLETKSLRWNSGYCEAFEAIGGLTGRNWIDGWAPELAGTFASTYVNMYRWHMAEEYEHRTVAYRVYHRLFGEPADEAHDFRIEMFDFGKVHIATHIERFRQAMLATYREGMSDAELEASREREAEVTQKVRERAEQLTQIVYNADYNPATNPAPEHLEEALALAPSTRD